MRHLLVLNLLKKEKGFSLFELVVVMVIMGIMSAVGVPSLIGSQRQEKVKEAYSKIRGALVEAQFNANRKSAACTVTITTTGVTGSPSGCLLENITFDSSIVDINSSAGTLPRNIVFTYKGTTSNAQTLQIRRKTFSGTAMPETGKCIVISSIGMIRTGIYDSTVTGTNCNNVENKRYDNANP
jgi:prepilin-type N-terminal cleavage/methylation domain-containing protein